MCIYKVMYGEIALTLKKPGTATDDLFEFDYRVYWAHQHNIAHIIYANPGR
ncbi:hypothetical protein D3C77_716660 [compost metagenome]